VRLVHFADLHLGYRQYQRQTPAGINQREADVAAAFTRTVDRTIALAPDIVLIAGDFFHQIRPANPAILHAFSQMARLVRALPHAIIVIIAGNHDTPRSRDTVCILRLFSQLGVHVVDSQPKQLRFDDRGLALLCVPDAPRLEIELVPDPAARFNVLLAHAEVRGLLPDFDGRARASLLIEPADVERPGWDYIALGHYHVHTQMGPRAWYCGSVEYTSTNPWLELREERIGKLPGKGLIEFDLETGKHTFHPLPVSRPYVDLPPIEGTGLGSTELDAHIAAAIARCSGGIEDKVVRLVLRNVPRHVARDLNHKALREIRRAALHFNLDVRPPEVTRTSASGAPGRAATLAETLRDRLRDRPLDAELDRERFIRLGMDYLARVEAGTPRAMDAESL
jgi:exonuclease SbcD